MRPKINKPIQLTTPKHSPLNRTTSPLLSLSSRQNQIKQPSRNSPTYLLQSKKKRDNDFSSILTTQSHTSHNSIVDSSKGSLLTQDKENLMQVYGLIMKRKENTTSQIYKKIQTQCKEKKNEQQKDDDLYYQIIKQRNQLNNNNKILCCQKQAKYYLKDEANQRFLCSNCAIQQAYKQRPIFQVVDGKQVIYIVNLRCVVRIGGMWVLLRLNRKTHSRS